MADEPEVDWVTMKHPSHGKDAATATTTRTAFDEVWSELGWKEAKDEPAKSALDAVRVKPATETKGA